MPATKTPNKVATLTWFGLIEAMKDATEEQCLSMLKQELAGPSRLLWKQRLYQRFSKLRREREHKVYLKEK